MDDIRSTLGKRVILADGAMGTELYRRGFFVNRSYDLLNVEDPDTVSEIHRDYVNAGAQIIETNTFGANRNHLGKWNAAERVREVNLAAIKLARKAAGQCAWVAGSIGPSGLQPPPFGKESAETILELFHEQATALVEGGVDLLLLETFKNIQEAQLAVKAVRDVAPDTTLGLQFTFTQVYGGGYKDIAPDHAAMVADNLDIDFLGANCAGPRELIDVLAVYRNLTDKPLCVMANAGLPQDVDGRTVYMATPDYMGEYAMRFAEAGAHIIGGCCGTRPDSIRKMAHYLSGQMAQITEKPRAEVKKKASAEPLEPAPLDQCSRFGANLGKKFQISVELALPKGLDPSKPLGGAKMLMDNGIDIVNIPDGPRALARTSPVSLAVMLKERGMESIVHYCCRDRNLLGMQMDLIGAHMLGVHNILIIT
ncbi:MAG: homocysteine S-methyltransferase family protein, partial [Planctomycetota bacterium]